MIDDTPNPRGPDAVTHQLPAGELPPGWSLLGGQYEIVRVIASGGFGITYLARDTLGRDVAVKECFPLGLAQRQAATHAVSATSAGTSEHFETARAQFLREARMLAGLRHPNVVHVQTLFEENGTAYMAMDFIHGRDLHEEIVATDSGLSPPRVLELARDLLGALDYVHGQGVLHRDIKPQNIRIDRFGVPMLIDFGAARAETQARSRMAGTFRVVTDGYSPHEFYVSGAKQGPYSDLYALAATLHHIISGSAPIAADERASAIATGQPDPYRPIAGSFPGHDPRLLHLIDRALRMTPGDRPQSAAAWLTALADAPTTLVAPAAIGADGPTRRSRPGAGLILGAALAAGGGAAIWAMQPAWLSPGMTEVTERIGQLEESLGASEAARGAAEAELAALQATLREAEAELARLETANGDMAATRAELEAARDARDAAAERIASLETDLAALDEIRTALDTARSERDAALERAGELDAENADATARIAELESDLGDATSELNDARARAEALAQVESDLTEAEAALYAATTRAGALQRQLADALEGTADLDTLRGELQALEAALSASEAERDRLLAEIAAAAAIPERESNAGEIEGLRARVADLEAENAELRAALGRAEAALVAGAPIEADPYVEAAALRAPNGTLSLLPRFSWDNTRVGLVDSSGGIALFNRATGAYEAHLARGLPDDVNRLGFSAQGSYLIATTPDGTPNRLYDIAARREILRFEPTTVTTANRAISGDEGHFVYTRLSIGGQTDVVLVALADTELGSPSEDVLTSVPPGVSVRVAFAETSNRILVFTPSLIRVFEPGGRLVRTAGNRLGAFAALSPTGGDQGLLVLRTDGEVVLFDNPLDQNRVARFEATDTYTMYRLSGDRLSFLRANGQRWEVIDLANREVRGSGILDAGDRNASISVSADGRMLFIGASGNRPARVIDVETGAEIQTFAEAAEGYFSFDNGFLATGAPGTATARIWRMSDTRAPPQ